MMKFIHYTIATGFGSGYSPLAPGTAGSLLALFIAYFAGGRWLILVTLIAVFFLLGVVSSTFVEKDSGREDPSIVVVDEMVGMWIALFLMPFSLKNYIVAFVFFRAFDILKPFPIDHSQKFSGGWGIMIDDVIAGIYALVLVFLATRFIF